MLSMLNDGGRQSTHQELSSLIKYKHFSSIWMDQIFLHCVLHLSRINHRSLMKLLDINVTRTSSASFTKFAVLASSSSFNLLKYKNIQWIMQYNHLSIQGSPNQAKWATSLPWFQCSRPISVKKRSFSRPVSLFKSVFFSPIIILFFQYSHKRSSHVPEI